MTITQKNYTVTNAELKGFQKALELCTMAEKYPTEDDRSTSLPPMIVSRNLSKLGLCLEAELKPFEKDLEKLKKKYKPYVDEEKGTFLKKYKKEAEEFEKESTKLLEGKVVAMLPVLPDLDEWGDFNVSFRVISLLDKLFKEPEEENKDPK